MQDTPDIYKQFPYGEIQNVLSSDTVTCLAGLMTGKGEPGEGDCLTEQIIGTTEHDLHQTVQTRLEAFATMV